MCFLVILLLSFTLYGYCSGALYWTILILQAQLKRTVFPFVTMLSMCSSQHNEIQNELHLLFLLQDNSEPNKVALLWSLTDVWGSETSTDKHVMIHIIQIPSLCVIVTIVSYCLCLEELHHRAQWITPYCSCCIINNVSQFGSKGFQSCIMNCGMSKLTFGSQAVLLI